MSRTTAALLLLLCASPLHAADRGFYLGGAATLSRLDAGGVWGDDVFEPGEIFEDEDDGVAGFAWADHLAVGIRPSLGYRFDRRFALRLGLQQVVPKMAQQFYSEYGSSSYYENTVNVEWKQRTLELSLLWRPGGWGRPYLLGGIAVSRVDVDLTAFEGFQYTNFSGDDSESSDYAMLADNATATGYVVGGGLEFPSTGHRSTVFLEAQYASLPTTGDLFGVDPWEVNAGGFSLAVGVRWFPFAAVETVDEPRAPRMRPAFR